MEQPDDAELVAAGLAHGAEAFGRIVERYRAAVFGAALARVGDFHDAEDVAQQVFLEAYEQLGRLKDPKRLGAWLRSMATHRSIDLVRQRKAAADLEKVEAPLAQASWQRQENKTDLREAVLCAIARLTPPQRETTALFYVNGYSVEEVARMQEVPVGTVKRRLHDAREKLKEEMAQMVPDVLKTGAPKDDFDRRVFERLSLYGKPPHARPWAEILGELMKIGMKGVGGFAQAMQSSHSRTRIFTVQTLASVYAAAGSSESRKERLVELLKKGLRDRNKKVRRWALDELLDLDVPEKRVQSEFIPAIVPLLNDPTRIVRHRAAWQLQKWARDVPLEAAATALARETVPSAREEMAELVRRITTESAAVQRQ